MYKCRLYPCFPFKLFDPSQVGSPSRRSLPLHSVLAPSAAVSGMAFSPVSGSCPRQPFGPGCYILCWSQVCFLKQKFIDPTMMYWVNELPSTLESEEDDSICSHVLATFKPYISHNPFDFFPTRWVKGAFSLPVHSTSLPIPFPIFKKIYLNFNVGTLLPCFNEVEFLMLQSFLGCIEGYQTQRTSASFNLIGTASEQWAYLMERALVSKQIMWELGMKACKYVNIWGSKGK